MEYLTPIIDIFKQLIAPIAALLTPKQWLEFLLSAGAALFMAVLTMLAVYVVRFVWTKSPIPGDDSNRKRKIVLRSSCVAFGVISGKLMWSPAWFIDWYLAGFVFGGGGALLAWHILWPVVQVKWPNLAEHISMQDKED